ncbi:hypothetical protein Tco_0885605 [Tanacetum coccineum]
MIYPTSQQHQLNYNTSLLDDKKYSSLALEELCLIGLGNKAINKASSLIVSKTDIITLTLDVHTPRSMKPQERAMFGEIDGGGVLEKGGYESICGEGDGELKLGLKWGRPPLVKVVKSCMAIDCIFMRLEDGGGIFEGGDVGELGFGNGGFSGFHGGLWWLIMDEEDDELNDVFVFDDAVRVNTLKLKKLMNFFRSRKVGMIWSFGFLGVCKRTNISFIYEDGLAIEWNYENLIELLERESDEFVLNHEGDDNDTGVISLKSDSTIKV